MSRMIDSEEVARTLGVKVSTVYAYVSRGLLSSHPSADGRRSLFDADEIERFPQRNRGGRLRDNRSPSVVTTITKLRSDGPEYRGHLATELAKTHSFEQVADILWRTEPGLWEPYDLEPSQLHDARDILRWTAVMAGAQDPVRSDLRPEAVARSSRRLVSTMVAAHKVLSSAPPEVLVLDNGEKIENSIAQLLAIRLTSGKVTAGIVRAVNGMLITHADHELSTASFVVRVAAFARADVYDSVLAGLCTVAAPFHDHYTGTELAYSFLGEALSDGPERAINDSLRLRGVVPGLGHAVYVNGDPRLEVLVSLFREIATDEQIKVVDGIMRLSKTYDLPHPNANFGMAAIMHAAEMPRDAGHTIFAIARTVGWVAHYLEELQEPSVNLGQRAVILEES